MKIILKKNFESLGSAGDIVNVKPGYARNFLIPNGYAMPHTSGNLKVLKEENKHKAYRKDKEKRIAEDYAKKLEKVSITAAVKVGEDDKVFGSITSQQIADMLKDKGFEIDKKKIILTDSIKALGIYSVPIRLHSEVEGKVKVWVVKE